jgi:protein gp37
MNSDYSNSEILPDGPYKLHWIVVGGESGHDARPMHPDWARALRDQCVAAKVPFFFKQWGEWSPTYEKAENGKIVITEVGEGKMIKVGKKQAGRLLDGVEWNQYPEVAA